MTTVMSILRIFKIFRWGTHVAASAILDTAGSLTQEPVHWVVGARSGGAHLEAAAQPEAAEAALAGNFESEELSS